MEKNKLRVAIVTNVIASYRSDFYKRIFSNEKIDVKVFCQQSMPGMDLNTVHDEFKEYIRLVRFISMKKEKLVWQFLPILKLYSSYDTIVFYGNPRVLSNVIFSILLKVLGKKVIIWGQAHTAGANSIAEKLRLVWWKLFDYIFLYTDNEVEDLRNKGFKTQQMIGMNNGLSQKEIDLVIKKWSKIDLSKWKVNQGVQDKTILLSCARLEIKNCFEQMIPIIKLLVRDDETIVWAVIGKGEQEGYLKDLIKREGLDNYVLWLGAIYDESELAPWFLSSKLLIHPGAIGLTLLHAFGYGLPVITHNEIKSQMPEIAALNDEVNGLLFKKGDSNSLLKVISKVVSDDKKLKKLSEAAYETAKNNFNTEVMAERFFLILTM